jgi:copper chaperone CopZ
MKEDVMEELMFSVPGMTCGHCESAVRSEVGKVPGVSDVHVDLDSKTVVVHGQGLSRPAIFAAVDEAGFEVVTGDA